MTRRELTFKSYITLLLAACVTVSVGCHVQGYAGPALPAHETANIFISKTGGIALTSINVDGQEITSLAEFDTIRIG